MKKYPVLFLVFLLAWGCAVRPKAHVGSPEVPGENISVVAKEGAHRVVWKRKIDSGIIKFGFKTFYSIKDERLHNSILYYDSQDALFGLNITNGEIVEKYDMRRGIDEFRIRSSFLKVGDDEIFVPFVSSYGSNTSVGIIDKKNQLFRIQGGMHFVPFKGYMAEYGVAANVYHPGWSSLRVENGVDIARFTDNNSLIVLTKIKDGISPWAKTVKMLLTKRLFQEKKVDWSVTLSVHDDGVCEFLLFDANNAVVMEKCKENSEFTKIYLTGIDKDTGKVLWEYSNPSARLLLSDRYDGFIPLIQEGAIILIDVENGKEKALPDSFNINYLQVLKTKGRVLYYPETKMEMLNDSEPVDYGSYTKVHWWMIPIALLARNGDIFASYPYGITMENAEMYTYNAYSAVDASTGEQLWRVDLPEQKGAPKIFGDYLVFGYPPKVENFHNGSVKMYGNGLNVFKEHELPEYFTKSITIVDVKTGTVALEAKVSGDDASYIENIWLQDDKLLVKTVSGWLYAIAFEQSDKRRLH